MKTQAAISVFTALGASLCCISPALAMVAGTAGVASTFSWVEPFRPYLVSATVFALGISWFQILRTPKEDDCGCEKKASFFQSKGFMTLVTLAALLLVTFPTYSRFLFDNKTVGVDQDQQQNSKVELAIKGMTCTSCEMHIEVEVKQLKGVTFVRASYEKGSAIVEFDDRKVKREEIIATINSTGYEVDGSPSSGMLAGKENCTAASCQIPTGTLPKEVSRNLVVIQNVDQIKTAFNSTAGKTRFVAILSSTCKWCLLGAESIQKGVIDNAARKDISMIVIWTNMLQSDAEATAYHAASLFDNKNVTQFFDHENKFGDIAAKAISSEGKQAWDIYMFFDRGALWSESLPRPFEYTHQLGPTNTWVDPTKYFCGNKLTERLAHITKSL